MSDASGNLVEGPYTYDAYGNCFSGVTACGSGGEPYRFTGRRYDPETGLYYYRARYYDPQKGRFLQTDPVGYSADLNFYTYVGNDPADRNDPNGLASEANGGSDSDCAGTDSSVTHCYAGSQYQGGQGETTKSGNAGEGSIAASAEFLAATAACKNCATGASKAQADDDSNPQVVQRAVITALKILNPKQDETKNIQPYTDNFAKAVNPKAINTQSWTEQYSLHASAIESPPIPSFSSYAVKLYNDPKLGNVIAVVYPTNSVWHYVYVIPYELGYPVNAKIGREFLNQQSGGW